MKLCLELTKMPVAPNAAKASKLIKKLIQKTLRYLRFCLAI